MNLRDAIIDAIWESLESEDDFFANRVKDSVYPGHSETFSMKHIAEHVIEKLGLTQTWAPATVLHDGYVDADTQWEYDDYDHARRQIDTFNRLAANRQDVATRAVGRWVMVDEV